MTGRAKEVASGRAKEVPVRVGGKLRHVRLDNNALCVVEELTGESMLDGKGRTGVRFFRALCYAALLSGCRAYREKPDFTVEDVGDWMEEEPALLEAVLPLVIPAMPEEPETPPGPQVVPEEPAVRTA